MFSPRQGISDLPDICYRHGMHTVVISPGSRNAPLIFSFTNHSKMECLSIVDERSAAYFALGLALKTHRPVGLICTSGTAALNYAPAIAEAYYQNIPLVVITADRPSEWIDQADGQTIRQSELYRNFIKQSFNLPVETASSSDFWYFTRSVNEAMNAAVHEPFGPVHLNIPLREPLYTPLPKQSADIHVIQNISAPQLLPYEAIEALLVRWNSSSKKMIICGADVADESRFRALTLLSANPSVVIVAENLSNLHGEMVISSPERFFALLTEVEASAFRPDLLITVGHSIVSGRLKKYLRQHTPLEHWHIQPSPSSVDTFQCLTQSIVASPGLLLRTLVEREAKISSNYRDLVLTREMHLRVKHRELVEGFPYSDLTVFGAIMARIPEDCNLHLANSTPIRYSQLFRSRADVTYHCNRGTSGIDGCISTAAGASVASTKTTLLISGDVSFVYDSNGLWNKHLKGNFKIIVINNGGGNIFRLIDTGKDENPAREFFETPHSVNIKHLAEAFGANHYLCQSQEELAASLNWLFAPANRPSILEIVTDFDVNTTVFKDYYKQIHL